MKKKIYFPFINGLAGGDVYFDLLAKSLDTSLYTYKIEKFSYFEILLRELKIHHPSKCDLVHTTDETGSNFFIKNKPFVVTCLHSPLDNYYYKYCSTKQKLFYKFYLYRAMKKSFSKANKIIAISEYTKKSIEKTFAHLDVKVIYNGIDINKFKPKSNNRHDGKIRLFFVGNLIKRKGADLLPLIIERLNKNFELYYTSGLRSKKTFKQELMFSLGKLDEKELIKEYQKCDILLFPSRLEGFGYAVAEAMACGKPIVTTNCSSLPELVINNKGGFLCEIDNVNNFVEKIKTLSENKYLMKKMGQFNRRRIVEKFNLKKMGKEYKQLYDELLRG